jgi:radical SAM superfamily enzyme YgiQ (UPF0313 family)
VELADDDTFVDKAWGLSLVRGIQPYRVKWFTETDVTVADSEPLLDALPRSGCRQLLVGFEALDAEAVAGLEDRSFKAPRVAGYADTVARIQARGVSVNGCFVLGADAHTPEVFRRVADFAEAVGLAEVQVTVLTPFPGTPLHDRLRAQGRLLAESDWASMTLFDVAFRPARMTVRELEEGLLETFARLYAADRVRARRRAFHSQARAGRRAARDAASAA